MAGAVAGTTGALGLAARCAMAGCLYKAIHNSLLYTLLVSEIMYPRRARRGPALPCSASAAVPLVCAARCAPWRRGPASLASRHAAACGLNIECVYPGPAILYFENFSPRAGALLLLLRRAVLPRGLCRSGLRAPHPLPPAVQRGAGCAAAVPWLCAAAPPAPGPVPTFRPPAAPRRSHVTLLYRPMAKLFFNVRNFFFEKKKEHVRANMDNAHSVCNSD